MRRLAAGIVAGLATASMITPARAESSAILTSPESGSVLSGKIRLDADAEGDRVDYYVNGIRVAYDKTPKDFSETWDTRRALDGDYEIVVLSEGVLSDPVKVTVDNSREPAPEDNSPAPNDPPVEESPAEESPVEESPQDKAPVDEAPVDEAPVDEAPVDEAPVDEVPADEAPVAPAAFPECDTATAGNVIQPQGPEQFRPDFHAFSRQTVMDATGSSWTRESAGDYPVIFKDQPYPPGTVCWLGGSITSSEDMGASWEDVWHHTYSFYTDHPYTTIVGLNIDNAGDCIGIKDPGDKSLTRIYAVSLTNCHDDAIENDLMKSVAVSHSLIEGYVLFAGRGGSAGAEDGRNNTFRINKVVGWLKPQEAVYKGPSPGTGPLFKRPKAGGSQGYEPQHTITNSVFRVDQEPNHGGLSIPPGPHSNNVIVWTGEGDYPGEVPTGFRVTTDISVWENARAEWVAEHR